jgi:Cof subfamily protein (haloacid dehalogenase superfamily)
MSYKIVFFDIDGTLLNTNHIIPPSTVRAVQQLKENGVHVAIATGRSPYHLKSVAQELGIDTFVSFNGSYNIHQGKVVYHNPLAPPTLDRLESLADQNSHPMVFLSADTCYSNTENHPDVMESFNFLKLPSPDYRQKYWQEKPIYQAFLYCNETQERPYLDHYQEVTYIRWHPQVIDILPPNGSKARGIEALLQHLGLSPADAVAFGDGLNDKEMLSFVGMGVAMGNAHADLKPHANMITRHVNEDGIHHGLKQLRLI